MEKKLEKSDQTDEQDQKEPWFADGLRFKCTGCGKCCTGSPGYVFLGLSDLKRLAEHFSLSPAAFANQYIRKVDEKISLIDRPGSDHCIFLVDNKCSVYEARPQQCRTFPWWLYFLRDADAWQNAGQRCEGINHPDAPVVSALVIQEQCLTYLDNLLDQNFSVSLNDLLLSCSHDRSRSAKADPGVD